MTPQETLLLTRYVKACCPQQHIDEYTPDAWHDLLADLDAADCRAAVAEIVKRQPFIAVSDIRTEVKRIRRDRIERSPLGAPPAELTDEPGKYRDALRAGIRRIADGRSVNRAIGELPSAAPAPVAEVRRQLGPAIPSAERHLPPEEIARRQAAESRAARGANVITGTVISDEDPAA